MGCPVPKVCKTGAGAALLEDEERAVAVARAAASGSGLPVTVKLRSGLRPGDERGLRLARALVERAGVAGISIHPRHASQRHRGAPNYGLVRSLVAELPVPVLVSGGLHTSEQARTAFAATGAAAVLLARGSLGNPWLFEQLLRGTDRPPSRQQILAELDWVMDRAVDHLGPDRAASYLRKFYPWYIERLFAQEPPSSGRRNARALLAAVQTAADLDAARALMRERSWTDGVSVGLASAA
jgi:tRNA-dihydrouridine synthase